MKTEEIKMSPEREKNDFCGGGEYMCTLPLRVLGMFPLGNTNACSRCSLSVVCCQCQRMKLFYFFQLGHNPNTFVCLTCHLKLTTNEMVSFFFFFFYMSVNQNNYANRLTEPLKCLPARDGLVCPFFTDSVDEDCHLPYQ